MRSRRQRSRITPIPWELILPLLAVYLYFLFGVLVDGWTVIA